MELSAITAAPKIITIGEREFTFHRLTLRDWGELEQAALESYRRDFLKVRISNADILGNGDAEAYKNKVTSEALALTSKDLPRNVSKIPKLDPAGKPQIDEDGEFVFEEKEVEYAIWWFNAKIEGRLHAIWLSLRKGEPSLTVNDVDNLLMDEFMKAGYSADSLADIVGEISSPSGNSQTPPQQEAVEAKKKPGQAHSGKSAKSTKRRRKKSRS